MLNTQLAATNQANFEALMALTVKAFAGVEQLTALNLQVAKGGLDQVKETGVAVLSARDPQTLLALQASLMQPAAEQAAEVERIQPAFPNRDPGRWGQWRGRACEAHAAIGHIHREVVSEPLVRVPGSVAARSEGDRPRGSAGAEQPGEIHPVERRLRDRERGD